MSTQSTDTTETQSATESRPTNSEREESSGAPMTFAPDDDHPIPGLFESESNETRS